MIHTLRPAKERLQRNLSLHAGTTLRRALFNAFNEQPSVLPVLEEDKPTNVRVSAPDMPTNVCVSDIPTNVCVSDIPTNVRVSDIPTNVRVSDKPTNVRVYEDDAVTNVVVTDPERVRSREERNDALEEEDSREKLIELNEKVSGKVALLARGRVLHLEDDVQCTCSDTVFDAVAREE